MYFRFMDDVTFGCSGPYWDVWRVNLQPTSSVAIPGQSLMSMSALFCIVFCSADQNAVCVLCVCVCGC